VSRFVSALLFPALLCGCTDLDAVGKISSQLVSASGSWDGVSADIAGSCVRQQSLNPDVGDCSSEKAAANGMAGANAILQSYFTALGDSANGSNFSIQPGLDSAAGSVAGIPGINAGQVQAAAGLVGLLAKVATEAMREATLRDLIAHAPEARSLIAGIQMPLGPRLARQLDAERSLLGAHYGRLILAQGDRVADLAALCSGPGAARFSGTGFLLAEDYCRRVATVDQREAALADYRASLADADRTLGELQSSKSRLKGKALARRLFSIGVDLDAKITALHKAFA